MADLLHPPCVPTLPHDDCLPRWQPVKGLVDTRTDITIIIETETLRFPQSSSLPQPLLPSVANSPPGYAMPNEGQARLELPIPQKL